MPKVRRTLVLLLTVLAFVVTPLSWAQERVDELPPIRSFTSSRIDMAITAQGQTFAVGKGLIENPNRVYFVFKTIAIGDLPESTLEVVVYDGAVYTREDEDPQWYVQEDGLPVNPPTTGQPTAIPPEIPITLIGTVDIAGTPTSQYQLWIDENTGAADATGGVTTDSGLDYLTIDMFIGQQINYLYQLQATVYADDPDLGQVSLGATIRFSDIDVGGLVVTPPTGAIPAEQRASAMRPLLYQPFGSLMAPFTVPALLEAGLHRQ
jgi:hypothetical protein